MANDVKSAVKLDRPSANLAEQITRDVAAHAATSTAQIGRATAESTARAGETAARIAGAATASATDAAQGAKQAGGDFLRMFADLRLPGLPNMQALVEAHRRNLEAFGAANRAVMEGAQAIARRNMEIAQQSLQHANETIRQMTSTEAPQAKVAQQADAMKRQYEAAIGNVRDVQTLCRQTGGQVAETLNRRFFEAVDEIKSAVEATHTQARPI